MLVKCKAGKIKKKYQELLDQAHSLLEEYNKDYKEWEDEHSEQSYFLFNKCIEACKENPYDSFCIVERYNKSLPEGTNIEVSLARSNTGNPEYEFMTTEDGDVVSFKLTHPVFYEYHDSVKEVDCDLHSLKDIPDEEEIFIEIGKYNRLFSESKVEHIGFNLIGVSF